MQQAIPPPGVHGKYGPAPGSGYPPQGYPQPQNMGVNPQGGYPTQASIAAACTMPAKSTHSQCLNRLQSISVTTSSLEMAGYFRRSVADGQTMLSRCALLAAACARSVSGIISGSLK